MEQRFTIVTRDLARSTSFFERLGWRRSGNQESITFFQCGCVALALYPTAELAKGAGVSAAGEGFPGFTISYNTRSKQEVDEVLEEAKLAGAGVIKPPENAFLGWVFGVFPRPRWPPLGGRLESAFHA
jgi:catechol 2,3-dioxygenase-like lactoylglutathione lyase family enzyme